MTKVEAPVCGATLAPERLGLDMVMSFKPTRRSFIAGATSALAFPHLLAAQGRAFDVDVAIVGAGSAGLAAAHELQKLGKSFAVVEARDRIGGRVVTDRSLGAAFEGGALYIHWAETNPWAEVARTLGMETTPDRGPRGAFRIFEKGRPVPESERGRRRAAFQTLSRELDLDPPSVPDISVVERVRNDGEDVVNAAAGMTRMALGEEPERVSARDYAQLWSGEDLYVRDGYGALVERFGAGLPVSLSTAVRAIRWGGPGVEVETTKGTIRARRAIVTVPVGVLIEESIAFDPILPKETLAGIEGLEMGVLAKVALGFRGARFGLPANTDIFEIEGPRATINFDCWPFDSDVVVAHVGGDHAREVIGLGTEGAVERMLESFARIVGNDARRHFNGGRVHGWIDDPWARGAYSHARPGQAGARALLARPVADKLWFAGEATGGQNGDFGGAMTAGGAFLAGLNAARMAAAG